MTISDEHQGLTISPQSRVNATAGLCCWLATVAVYYLVVWNGLPGFHSAQHDATVQVTASPPAAWPLSYPLTATLLLVFPALLVPYIKGSLMTILGRGVICVDSASRQVRRGRKVLFGFDEVRRLEWRAINGTCEELGLYAIVGVEPTVRPTAEAQMSGPGAGAVVGGRRHRLATERRIPLLSARKIRDIETAAQALANALGVAVESSG